MSSFFLSGTNFATPIALSHFKITQYCQSYVLKAALTINSLSNNLLPGMVSKIRNYVRHSKRDLLDVITYFRMSLSGNRVNYPTDFENCEHPVLLLYGFGATRGTVSILEKRLRHDGFCVFSLNLGGIFDTFNTRCIEELSNLVEKNIERLCQQYRLNKISIIGHSKGGLIGHYYIKRLSGAKRVRSLITLGTPHNGNPWALLGLATPLILVSKSIRQMFPMSSFIKRLKEGHFPRRVRFVSIYSKDDRVCYYKSAILDIPANGGDRIKNIELKGLRHSDLVMRKTVYNIIKEELLKGDRT
jgi:triacylglycerol esterase/lipase EstA (alpha/beta hydrolase family)